MYVYIYIYIWRIISCRVIIHAICKSPGERVCSDTFMTIYHNRWNKIELFQILIKWKHASRKHRDWYQYMYFIYVCVCCVCVWLDFTLKRESHFESPGDNKLSASVETRVQAWASQAPTRQLTECPLKIGLLCESNICTISLLLFYMGFVSYYTQSQSDMMYYVPNTETSALSWNKHRTPINEWLLYQTQRPNHILLTTNHKAPEYFMCSTEGTFKLP